MSQLFPRAGARAILIVCGLLSAVAGLANAAPLELDPTFNGTGRLFIDGWGSSVSITQQADGKLLLPGLPSTQSTFAVARVNVDGTLDSSFGTGGKATVAIGDGGYANQALLQGDGKIILIGNPKSGSRNTFGVARLNTDGSVDSSFGTAGRVILSPGDDAGAIGGVLQSDGKIIIGGYVTTGSTSSFAVARLNADGTPDTSFNGTGTLVLPYANSSAAAVAVQPDGKIILGGNSYATSPQTFALVRLLPTGALDTSFGTNGFAVYPFASGGGGSMHALVLRSDGKIVTGGYGVSQNGFSYDFAAMRMNADGSLDTSFNGTGQVVLPQSANTEWGMSMAVYPDGRTVLAGMGYQDITARPFGAVCLTPTGGIDPTFNDGATLLLPMGTTNGSGGSHTQIAWGVILPDANTVILSGSGFEGNTETLCVARLKMDLAAPSVAITTPAANANLPTAGFTSSGIGGTASDDVSVAAVRVKLYRDRGGVRQYWNGTDFTTTAATLTATLASPGATATTWHLNAPPAAKLDLGAYSIQVAAVDGKSKTSTFATRSFTLVADSTAPTAAILHPAANASLLPPAFASGGVDGTATDDGAVASIAVKLYRTNAGVKEYWNGSAWVTTSVTATLSTNGLGTGSAKWKVNPLPSSSTLVSGSYGVQAVVKDASGNSVTVSRPFSIVVDNTLPTVSFVSPSANQHVAIGTFNANTVRGTATDNLAVASVTVKLYRTRNGVKEYWNGAAFGSASVASPITTTGLNTGSATWNLNPAPGSSALDGGTYSAQVSAKDTAGNTSAVVTRNFVVDAPAAGLSPSGSEF